MYSGKWNKIYEVGISVPLLLHNRHVSPRRKINGVMVQRFSNIIKRE